MCTLVERKSWPETDIGITHTQMELAQTVRVIVYGLGGERVRLVEVNDIKANHLT